MSITENIDDKCIQQISEGNTTSTIQDNLLNGSDTFEKDEQQIQVQQKKPDTKDVQDVNKNDAEDAFSKQVESTSDNVEGKTINESSKGQVP